MAIRLSHLLSDSAHAIYVAESDSVLGWIHVCVLEFLESGMFAEIAGMVVTQSQRGKGIGTQLVAQAEQWARAKGTVRLRVRSNVVRHETHEFYLKCGFSNKKTQKVFEKNFLP
jgi:GNAT superfamily N-acetyltransferase